MDEPNTKVTNCLGFFENQEIVESLKDSAGIRRMTAKSCLFEKEARENSTAFPKLDMKSVSTGRDGKKGILRKRNS